MSNSPKARFPDGYHRDSPKFLFRWSLDLTSNISKGRVTNTSHFLSFDRCRTGCARILEVDFGTQGFSFLDCCSQIQRSSSPGDKALGRGWARIPNQHMYVPMQALTGYCRETSALISTHKLHPYEYDQDKQPTPDAPCLDQRWLSSVKHTLDSHHSHWSLKYEWDF